MEASIPAALSEQPSTITTSSDAPEMHLAQQLSPVTPSSSLDNALTQASMSPPIDNTLSPPDLGGSPADTDPQIIEALRSKDRLWVLKLGESMETLIVERKVRIEVSPATSYQRMLVHRCSSYYKLVPETQTSKTIHVYYKPESRIPLRRMSELVPAEESAQPAFKIMRRGNLTDRSRARHSSQPGSVAGDDADLSDVEASEAGSIGGRSNATGSGKKYRTIEEREAAYQEARSRIFMDFQEKDKDASANSSTHSLVSGSASTGGERSSAGDADDSASSAATESEWSGPVNRDKREGRRGGSTTSSLRSFRSESYHNMNGSGSSRNSRAQSPSNFSYPTLYESPSPASYDPAYGPQPPPQGYYPYYYPYPPPVPAPMPPYQGPYPYYPSYGYHTPPHPTHHSDPTSPGNGEQVYHQQPTPPHPQQPVGYQGQYVWSPPIMAPPTQQQLSQPSPMNMNMNLPGQGPPPPPPPPPPVPMQPAVSPSGPHPYPYVPGAQYPSYPGFYPAPPVHPGPSMPPPPVAQQSSTPPFYPNESPPIDPRVMGPPNGHGYGNNHNVPPGMDSMNSSRTPSRNSNGMQSSPVPRRGGAPRARQTWSHGSNSSSGTIPYVPQGAPPAENFGPRLMSRRQSGTSSGSVSSGGNRTPGDEASSTTSTSSTSSSDSRRTFTSTSSKHPLPARPDWAVGLKPHPTLHPPRNHDHSNSHSRTMSPARIGGQSLLHGQNANHHLNNHHLQQPSQQPPLHSTDFPPLSSAPEKRPPPTAGGAWTNSSNMRSILSPGPQGPANPALPSGNALVHYPIAGPSHPNGPQGHQRVGDNDSGFERPPPKGNAELFNPKGGGRKQTITRANVSPGAIDLAVCVPPQMQANPECDPSLTERLGGMALGEQATHSGTMLLQHSNLPPGSHYESSDNTATSS